jgi:hypothetical protein
MLMVRVCSPFPATGKGVRTRAEKTKSFFPARHENSQSWRTVFVPRGEEGPESTLASYPPPPPFLKERGNRDEKINNLLY